MDQNGLLSFVCFANSNWHDPLWTNRQHIMSRLAKKHNVLYLDLPLSFGQVLRKKDARLLRNYFSGLKRVQDNLFLYAPKIVPPDWYGPVHKTNIHLIKFQIKRIISKVRFEQPILWLYRPEQLEYIENIPRKLLIYHCTDNYYQYMKLTGTGRHLVDRYLSQENKLVKKADIIFTTSKGLYEKFRASNLSTFYAPNVGDIAHFKKANLEDTIIAEDIKQIKRPIVGFMGAVDNYKIDFELIRYIAEKKPEYSIVLIGPVGICDRNTSREKLPGASNIHYLGQKQYAVLPDYLKAFDVCIIPYNLNSYTENVFPLKYYEYMASGKPIVSTKLPSLPEYDDVVYLAKSHEEFLEGIISALHDDTIEKKKKRIEIAEKNSWDSRVQQFLEVIHTVLETRK